MILQAIGNRESCQRIQEQIGNRIFEAVSHGRIPRPEDLMKTEDVYELKSKVYGAEGRPLPPIVTHNLIDTQKVNLYQIKSSVNKFSYNFDLKMFDELIFR